MQQRDCRERSADGKSSCGSASGVTASDGVACDNASRERFTDLGKSTLFGSTSHEP